VGKPLSEPTEKELEFYVCDCNSTTFEIEHGQITCAVCRNIYQMSNKHPAVFNRTREFRKVG
jgi:hypothetical protein